MTFDEAKKQLAYWVQDDGSLRHPTFSTVVYWRPGDADVALNGDFSLIDLEAIVTYVRWYPK